MNYASLSTEKVNPRSRHLDRLTPAQIVQLMNREDGQVFRAIAQARPAIARAIRLIEAAECPPTFGTPPNLVQAIMAGGKSAVFKSKEGSEDSEKEAISEVRRLG